MSGSRASGFGRRRGSRASRFRALRQRLGRPTGTRRTNRAGARGAWRTVGARRDGDAGPGWERAGRVRGTGAVGRRHDDASLASALGDGHGDGLLEGCGRGKEGDENASHLGWVERCETVWKVGV
jgi:hypothetical protein